MNATRLLPLQVTTTSWVSNPLYLMTMLILCVFELAGAREKRSERNKSREHIFEKGGEVHTSLQIKNGILYCFKINIKTKLKLGRCHFHTHQQNPVIHTGHFKDIIINIYNGRKHTYQYLHSATIYRSKEVMTKVSGLGSWYPNFKRVTLLPWPLNKILPTFDTLIRRSGHFNAWKASVMKSVHLFVSGPYWNATAYEQNECLNS